MSCVSLNKSKVKPNSLFSSLNKAREDEAEEAEDEEDDYHGLRLNKFGNFNEVRKQNVKTIVKMTKLPKICCCFNCSFKTTYHELEIIAFLQPSVAIVSYLKIE